MTNKTDQINIPLEPIDRILLGLTGLGILALIGYVIYSYADLPESVPVHFNINGEADRWGSKASIQALPIIGIGLTIILGLTPRFPKYFNFPVKVTESNKNELYRLAFRMIRVINVIILVLFGFTTVHIVNSARGNQSESMNFFFLVFMMLMIGTTIYYLSKMYKAKSI